MGRGMDYCRMPMTVVRCVDQCECEKNHLLNRLLIERVHNRVHRTSTCSCSRSTEASYKCFTCTKQPTLLFRSFLVLYTLQNLLHPLGLDDDVTPIAPCLARKLAAQLVDIRVLELGVSPNVPPRSHHFNVLLALLRLGQHKPLTRRELVARVRIARLFREGC